MATDAFGPADLVPRSKLTAAVKEGDAEIRLACLRLAKERGGNEQEILETAQKFSDFVKGEGDRATQENEGKN